MGLVFCTISKELRGKGECLFIAYVALIPPTTLAIRFDFLPVYLQRAAIFYENQS